MPKLKVCAVFLRTSSTTFRTWKISNKGGWSRVQVVEDEKDDEAEAEAEEGDAGDESHEGSEDKAEKMDMAEDGDEEGKDDDAEAGMW